MKKEKNLMVQRSIVIHSTADRIWDVLTDPGKIKLYMFGSEAVTDWKVGSSATFTRESGGQKYQDKGQILEVSPARLLKFSYWSSQEGYEDIPQHYSVITYLLEKENDQRTKLTYRREKIPIAFEQRNQERYLPRILENIKGIAEKG